MAHRRNSVETGTIADQADFVHNRTFLADQNAQREAKANLAKSGVAGLAENYADPTQIALAKRVIEDEWARDAASAAEEEAGNYIKETDAMENDLINTQINTDSNVMGSAFGVSQNQQQVAAQIAASRASVLPSILGMALGAGAQIATGAGWFSKKSGGK